MKPFLYKLAACLVKPFFAVHRRFSRRGYRHIGKNVLIGKNFIGTERYNISIGDNTSIGPNYTFYAGIAPITIGRYVMIAPNVSIVSGNHRTDVIGEYMRNIKNEQKLADNDMPVIIEDDVWVGIGVIILKGVTIGRGSIISAGAIVRKSVPPYSIYIREDKIIERFTPEEIARHEAALKQKYGE